MRVCVYIYIFSALPIINILVSKIGCIMVVKFFISFSLGNMMVFMSCNYNQGLNFPDSSLCVYCPGNWFSKTVDHSTQHNQSEFVIVQDQPNINILISKFCCTLNLNVAHTCRITRRGEYWLEHEEGKITCALERSTMHRWSSTFPGW